MNNQTILHKKANETIPLELLELILAKKPTGFGFVVQNVEADGKPDLSIAREETCPTMEQLIELMDNAKQWPMLMYFGELTDKDVHKDDIQPFVVHDADDAPFISFMLEGDFPKFSEVGSGHTEQFHLADKIIIPTIVDLCELTDGDLPKIMGKLDGDTFTNTLLSHIGHRGVLTIMPLEGEALILGRNDLGEVYEWGSTSQRHSYGDVKQEPIKEVAAEPVKKKFWGGKKATTPAATTTTVDDKGIHTVKDAATPGTAPRTSVPTVNNSTADPDKALSKEKPKETMERPPSFIHKNEDVKAWYKAMTGSVPQNWKKRIPVAVKQGTVIIKDLSELKAAMEKAGPALTAIGKAPTSGAEIKAEREAKADDLPVIGGKDLEKVLDFVAKHLDGQSNEMPDPKTIQAIESKLPTFSESLGIKPHEMLNWPASGIFAMAKMDSRAVALAFIEMRSLWRNTLKAEDLVGTATKKETTEKVTTTVTKSGEGTTITESVATAPAKKKGFWGKKRAA